MKVDIPVLSKTQQIELIKNTIRSELDFVYKEMNKLRNQMIDLNDLIRASRRI